MQENIETAANESPLLTIAIPSYNRAAFLDLCLRRINEEVDGLSEALRRKIKIFVSDNLSTDDTPSVIAKYRQMKVYQFDDVRNAVNIGPNPNIEQCYKSATTPYVWVLGDDDVILPGGLSLVLTQLEKQDVDIISLGAYGYKTDFLKPPISRFERKEIISTESPVEFSRQTHAAITFISTIIARSGISTERYKEQLENTHLPHLGWILILLQTGKRFVVVKNWLIAAKKNNSGGYGYAQVFAVDLKKLTNAMLKDHPKLIRTIQNGVIINAFPPAIVHSFRKRGSAFTEHDYKEKLKSSFSDNWRYYVFLVPLMNLPMFLAKLYFIFIAVVLPFFYSWLI